MSRKENCYITRSLVAVSRAEKKHIVNHDAAEISQICMRDSEVRCDVTSCDAAAVTLMIQTKQFTLVIYQCV